MATTKTMLSAAASIAASAVIIRSMVQEFFPRKIRDQIFSSALSFFTRVSSSSKLTINVHEFRGNLPNEMYQAVQTYLSSKISPYTRCLQVAKQEDSKGLEVTMEVGETVVDLFEGTEFRWKLICKEKQKLVFNQRRKDSMTSMFETKFFVLSFHKKHKEKALYVYLPHILQHSKNIKQEEKRIRIYSGDYAKLQQGLIQGIWNGVNLDHPSTFDTLAMDPELKRSVKEDLERFVRRKAYYRRVGKAWKRGYLLYGPPGTGKSSLIAAIANFLKFDIYDLELTEIKSNSWLRQLLVGTANRSIIVIEDIDCTIDLLEKKEEDETKSRGRNKYHNEKVTLSGLLNFIDGLWSGCRDERIIIFTTNYKEMLDFALLRPGRMDMHIHMSYCSPSSFMTLLSNYHNVDNHTLKPEVERLLREVAATPAEVAEELMKSDDSDDAMRCLIKFLEGKKVEASEENKKDESMVVEGSQIEELKEGEVEAEKQEGMVVEGSEI
ncbi:AAA-ATPase At3g50940-like [Dendrobium catenatum]|uniref:ATP-dependent zinc metalloprotease FTSH 5, mitochondrial n=1 Tax=Dendrobium catenatum TaxID=906689 RepID=A0A2I0VLS9_9ASPA|nr:AAA-ATPase At3g50940-like [Dendrobium catenatum]PKU64370.1 ATP-dependent zinc metalloprotease FTSH 5, mitochondrial [Dendrobium catenatum]